MLDLHCHILRGLDDGAADLEESRLMLEIASRNGIETIVTTPHYNSGIAPLIQARHEELSEFAVQYKIKLLTGCEYTLQQAVSIDGPLITLGGTSYLLIDLNTPYMPPYIEQHIFNIALRNYKIILAHVEKLLNISYLDKLLELQRHGVYFQINAASLLGHHGSAIRKTALKLINAGLCQIIASDAHNTRGRTFHLSEAADLICREFSSEAASSIFETNPNLILQNQEPEIHKFKRKSIFAKISGK
jgi:protein-tyrosine phosphatase